MGKRWPLASPHKGHKHDTESPRCQGNTTASSRTAPQPKPRSSAAPRPALRELCWADFEPPGHSLAPLRHPAEGTARRFGTKQRTQTTAALITAAARPAVLPARLSPQAASTRLPRGNFWKRAAPPGAGICGVSPSAHAAAPRAIRLPFNRSALASRGGL